jgi:hypothetical protein
MMCDVVLLIQCFIFANKRSSQFHYNNLEDTNLQI